MRALLRHSETGLYLQTPGQWTPSYHEALDFKSSVTAREYCRRHKLFTVQIVLKFDSDKYDIVLPVLYPTNPKDPAGPTLGA
ncbi:MAG: hypothetical protein JWR26_4998 [Pedosphaera sp.]|nr:hypothetical protein [Pedosphaera sp.]